MSGHDLSVHDCGIAHADDYGVPTGSVPRTPYNIPCIQGSYPVTPPRSLSEAAAPLLPTTAADRKATPIATGVLDYFPLAIAEIARLSKAGNDQHNPGQPLHWDKSKSTDHPDCLLRHLIERGTLDTDGQRHSAKVAWRALALLQTELEAMR